MHAMPPTSINSLTSIAKVLTSTAEFEPKFTHPPPILFILFPRNEKINKIGGGCVFVYILTSTAKFGHALPNCKFTAESGNRQWMLDE